LKLQPLDNTLWGELVCFWRLWHTGAHKTVFLMMIY